MDENANSVDGEGGLEHNSGTEELSDIVDSDSIECRPDSNSFFGVIGEISGSLLRSLVGDDSGWFSVVVFRANFGVTIHCFAFPIFKTPQMRAPVLYKHMAFSKRT